MSPLEETGLPRVRRPDGREVAYDPDAVRRSVRRAQSEAGEEDPLLADEVQSVVAYALRARVAGGEALAPAAPRVVEMAEIGDLVEDVLVQMGRTRLARALILHHDRRARSREALLAPSEAKAGRAPLVEERAGTFPWSPARIVAALVQEAGLAREEAEIVAARVEERVLDAGLRRLSTGLVRELVAVELLALGHRAALARTERVGLPRHDLRRIVESPPATPSPRTGQEGVSAVGPGAPARLEERLGAELLSRWALEDVFGERTSELLRSGELFLENLDRPHEPLVRSLPARLAMPGEPSPTNVWRLVDALAPLVSTARSGLVIEELGQALPAETRRARAGGRPRAGLLEELLRVLGSLGRAGEGQLGLSRPGGRGPGFLATLLAELARIAGDGDSAPRLYLSWPELEPALELEGTAEAAERLLECGRLIPVWSPPDAHWVAPGCRRRRGERGVLACGGALAVPFARLARRAGAWREDRFFEALAERLHEAVDAAFELDRFQRGRAASRREGLREAVQYALVPVGLADALRILGDGEVRIDQGARLLGLFAEAGARFGAERGLSVVASPFFGARAAERFAARDAAQRHAGRQPRLFAELPAPELAAETSYDWGWTLEPAAPEALAELCATLRFGALAPERFARDPGAPRSTERLAFWERFEQRRTAGADARLDPSPRRRGAADGGPLFRAGLSA